MADIAGLVALIPWDKTTEAENAGIRQMATRIKPPKQTGWEVAWNTNQTMYSFDEDWSHG